MVIAKSEDTKHRTADDRFSDKAAFEYSCRLIFHYLLYASVFHELRREPISIIIIYCTERTGEVEMSEMGII